MQEMLQSHDQRMDSLIDILDEKLDRTAIEALISNKIGKEELHDILPNMESFEGKMEAKIDESIDTLWEKLELKLVTWDKRMIQLR